MSKILSENRVYYFKDLEIYAENGIIHVVSKNKKHRASPENTVSVKDWRDRLVAIYRLGLGLEGSELGRYRDLMSDSHHAVEVMEAALRDALSQGDPFDPRVIEEHVREIKTSKKYTMKPQKIFT